jgi:hypothetical protein
VGLHKLVKRGQDALASGHGERGMLQLAKQGPKLLWWEALLGDGSGKAGHHPLDLLQWKFHGAKNAVKNPAKDLLACCPDNIAAQMPSPVRSFLKGMGSLSGRPEAGGGPPNGWHGALLEWHVGGLLSCWSALLP